MSSTVESQSIAGRIVNQEIGKIGLPRALECTLAAVGILTLTPLLAVCAVGVFLSSPGPIFFRQLRVGRYGRSFVLFKFRTMVVSSSGLPITASTDNRITRIGRFLHKWKLDELPELYNVLRGEMSFVGPRPEVPELVNFSDPSWAQILSSRPGITDPVTLVLRNEEAMLAMVEDKELYYKEVVQPFKINGYLKYLSAKSMRGDLLIIAQTAKAILFPEASGTALEKAQVTASE
jgi:lipopolysaccharide/colanic/teichoic acid biosynthesis glycosyltransferase